MQHTATGTWYFQSAFLIYKDDNIYWKLHKPELFSEKLEQAIPMYLSAVFTWHLIGVAVTVLIVWTIMHLVINMRCIVIQRNFKCSQNALKI